VETAASGDAIQGRVLLPTSSANVQKNTLEVKVELIDPPSGVTPEMLTTVTFLSPETQPSKASSKERERLFVPKELVQRDGDQAAVWVVNASGQAQRTSVDPGTESSDGLLEIKSGLDPTGKLITSPTDELKPGQRVEIDGEDPRLGLAAS
jgi:hypothetical protein